MRCRVENHPPQSPPASSFLVAWKQPQHIFRYGEFTIVGSHGTKKNSGAHVFALFRCLSRGLVSHSSFFLPLSPDSSAHSPLHWCRLQCRRFFFLLSGYILSYVYLQSGKPVNSLRFYQSRIARIYPLYLITLVLDTPFLFNARLHAYGLNSAALKTSITFLANLIMIQAWIPRLRGIDDPNWSLCVEAVFYFIFPLIGMALWKVPRRILFVSLGLLWIAVEIFLVYYSSLHRSELDFKQPLLQIPTFLAGIMVARIQMSWNAPKTDSIRTRTRLLFLTAILMIFAIPFLLKSLPKVDILTTMLVPLFAVIILIFSTEHYPFSRFLNAKFMVLLGEASYGLYLIHIPVYHLWITLHWDTIQALYPVYLALCIVLSILSFRYFETPTRLWLLGKFRPAS